MTTLFRDWFCERAQRPSQGSNIFLKSFRGNWSISFREFLGQVEVRCESLVGAQAVHEVRPVRLDYSLASVVEAFAWQFMGVDIFLRNPLHDAGTTYTFEYPKNGSGYCWLTSSGVKSEKKVWPHDIGTLTWTIPEQCSLMNLDSSKVFWVTFPPHTISGWKALLVAAECGASLIWEPFPHGNDVLKIFDQLNVYKPTSLALPPVFAEAICSLAKICKGNLPASLERVLCGGDHISSHLNGRFLECFDFRLSVFYGMTELAGPVCFCPGDQWQPNKVGKMLKGEVRAGDEGRLSFRGSFITAARCPGEWFLSEDCGSVDRSGEIFLLGRNSEWTVVQGTRVHLRSIEEEVLGLPEIQQARVSLVPADGAEVFLEALNIEVVLDDMQKDRDVRAKLDQLLLQRIPKIHVEVVERLKRTPSGKILRTKF